MFADDQIIVRCALFPRFLKAGAVDPLALFSFQLLPDDVTYATSVGCRALLPTQAAVHDFGCKTAAAANESKAKRGGRPLRRPEETVHYRGSYDLQCGPVKSIVNDVFNVSFAHLPEDDREAHCHIELQPKVEGVSKTQLGKARTRVIAELVSIMRDPSEHICPGDMDLRAILEEYHLP